MHALLFNFTFNGLAVLALCCLAKAILDFAHLKNKPLHLITSPILKITTLVTPALIPKTLHIFLAALWLLVARVGFYMVAGAYGLLPAVTP